MFRTDPDASSLVRVLDDNDPSPLPFTRPLLVAQGTAATTVIPARTDAMVGRQRSGGHPVEYRTYPGVAHRGVVAAPITTRWLG